MLKIKNLGASAEIYINGDIIDDTDAGFMQSWGLNTDGYQWPNDIKAKLDECKGKPLTVYINSDGGSVPAGVAIANMLSRHDAPTTAVVDGWCCSIATQIFFAAKNRQIPKNAYLMIHKPTVACVGNAEDMRAVADSLDTIQAGLETTYKTAAKKNVSDEQIHQMVDKETWLTGEAAAEFFEVEVLDSVQAVARFGATKASFKNIPKNINFEKLKNHDKDRVQIALALAKGVNLV